MAEQTKAEKKEEKRLSAQEVRKTMATSLAAAFGFIIGLVWNGVVQGAFAVAGVNLSPDKAPGNWGGLAVFAVTAVAVTVAMVILIIVISRWGSKE